jgi:hypothetical protein
MAEALEILFLKRRVDDECGDDLHAMGPEDL